MNYLKRIAKLIFSQTTIAIILLGLQLYIFYAGYTIFKEYITYFYGGYTILSIIVVIIILNNQQNPAFKMAWIIPVLALPIFGTFMYICIRSQLIPKKLNKKLDNLKKETTSLLSNCTSYKKDASLRFKNFSNYMYNNSFPTYSNTKIDYFNTGEDFYQDLLTELKKAKKFIFLEFFIIEEGIMWNSILEILKEKAKENVEVRLLYDGTCTISLLPRNYKDIMTSYGIKCQEYSPLKPFISTYHNNRDHRKIIVIDGEVSYTGGVNLADEYINEKIRFGYWKDTAIKITGNATNRFTLMFLEMWNISNKTKENFKKYLANSNQKENGYIIPFSDHPYDEETVYKNTFLDTINQAENYIHIMTPYLILDNELITALKLAAQKNIEVIIMMPHIPDKKYTYWLARTYYEELIKAGVKIYEFTEGFIHAKVMISDNNRAIVGSGNLDYRSLYLNFECGCYIYKHKTIKTIEEDFQETLKKCELITLKNCKNLKLTYKIIGKILRLIAPLM